MDIERDDSPPQRGLYWLGYWAPVVLYAGLIFYLSSQSYPEEYVPHVLLNLGDKVLHAMEYALLGLLAYRAFRHAAGTWCSRHAVLLAIGLATIYGGTDEWHQAFVPFRESDRWDLATDLLGACLGVVLWGWIDKARAAGCCRGPGSMVLDRRNGVEKGSGKEPTPEPEAR